MGWSGVWTIKARRLTSSLGLVCIFFCLFEAKEKNTAVIIFRSLREVFLLPIRREECREGEMEGMEII